MLFEPDNPIQGKADDLLGRSAYAHAIADALLSQRDSEAYVVGLYGAWGSGKTSLLNMVTEDIRSRERKDTMHIVSFSGWGCGTIAQLITSFNGVLREELKKFGRMEGAAKKLLRRLSDYGLAISDVYAPIGVASELYIKSHEKSLAARKAEIAKMLKAQKRKLIVVIDDIDRLPDEQVRQVFQFVSEVADFPNVVFVLPFDYKVVAASLSGVQGVDGEAYMRKVIQVPLSLPNPAPDSLLGLIEDEITACIDDGRDDFHRERLREIVDSLVLPYLETPRDVRRLQNVLRFNMSLLGEELNSIDVLGISALLAFDPVLYEWVKANKEILVRFRYGESLEDRKASIVEAMKRMEIKIGTPQLAIGRLSGLFPRLRTEQLNSNALWKERRVGCEDLFDFYFAGSLISSLPERSVGEAIRKGDVLSLECAAERALDEGTFGGFLQELASRLDDLPRDAAADVAMLLLRQLSTDPSMTDGGIFSIHSPNGRICFLARLLLKRVGPVGASEAISQVIGSMKVEALAVYAAELDSEKQAHDQPEVAWESGREALLAPEGLSAVELSFVNRINELIATGEFCFLGGYPTLIRLWHDIDSVGCEECWRGLVEDDPTQICTFIACAASKWSESTGMCGWYFREEVMEPIVPREEAMALIEELRLSNGLSGIDGNILAIIFTYCWEGYQDLKGEGGMSAATAFDCLEDWLSKGMTEVKQ